MSITITIDNNRPYCLDRDLQTYTTFDCDCEGENPDCPYCKGTGRESFEQLPFELNLANANFRTLANALGLDDDDYGETDGRVLLKALQRTPTELVLRETVESGNSYFAGIQGEQASRYFTALTEIANEAIRREEKVIWG